MLLDRILNSKLVWVIYACLILPIAIPFFAKIESIYYPVIDDLQVISIERDSNGVLNLTTINNVIRDCDFTSIRFYNKNNEPVLFRAVFDESMIDRWTMYGVVDTKGIYAITKHDCHFLYNSETKVKVK